MELFTLYTTPPILSLILFLFFGVIVYLNNRKSIVNITFILVCLATVWWQFSWFILFNTKNEATASYLVKIGYIGIIFIPVFFFHFFISFLQNASKLDRYLLYFSYLISLIFEFFLLTTNYFINGFYRYFWGFYPRAGFLHPFYLLLLTVLTVRALYLLLSSLKKQKTAQPKEYNQTKYILWALVFYIFAASDFFINYGIEFYPLGFLFILFFLGITAYAIIKHYFFGVKVILTEILVAAIAMLLLTQFFLSQSIFEYVWKGILFLLFVIFGYILIISILKEVQYREQLQHAYQELQKLDEAKSEFVSIASHQLRTPLTAIKGYVSLLLAGSYGELTDKNRPPIENIYKSSERLIKLINELLNISRIEAGKIEINFERAYLEEIIDSVTEELKLQAEERGLYLKKEKPKASLPELLIDKDKTKQVIMNVVDNAIKYTNKGGIIIKTKTKDSKALIEVSDTGEGMSKEEIAKLFKSFSRGSAGNELFVNGAGLGLHIARRFVEIQGGRIWAESPGKGKGSTVIIELPIKIDK